MAKLALVNNFDDAKGGPSGRTERFRKWLADLDVVSRNALKPDAHGRMYAAYDGFILSGSPHDVTDIEKPQEAWMKDQIRFILDCPKPVLGTCFGHQLLCHAFGATVDFIRPDVPRRNNTTAKMVLQKATPLLPSLVAGDVFRVEESHNQEVLAESLPSVLENVAVPEPAWQAANTALKKSVVQMVKHRDLPVFGTQFHPETFDGVDAVTGKTGGDLLRQFEQVCQVRSGKS